MNYLILIPKYVNEEGEGYSFPLGICYISSMLKKHINGNIYTLNLNHIHIETYSYLKSFINSNKIEIVLTGGLCLDYHIIYNLLKMTKEININIITIVGGGIITGDPFPAMEALEYADYGIIGEGEETTLELCNALSIETDISKIKGIIYKKEDQFFITEARHDIMDLDKIPWPDYKGFDFQHYLNNITAASVMATKRNTLFMLTSRSCPYHCTFCFHTSGNIYRQRSIDDIFQEMDYLFLKYEFDYIFFVDELFGTSLERLKIFCKKIKKYKIKGWYSYFRVDQISEEKVELLKQSGCKCMFLGLESADNKVLQSMNKKISIEQIEKALLIIAEKEVPFDGCFIFGDSEETYETAMNTLNWWYEHQEYKLMLLPINCYPGTKIYQSAVSEGRIKDKVQFLKDGCPLVNVSKMSDEEYADILDKLSIARNSLSRDFEFIKNININYENKTYSLKASCSNCGNENDWVDHNMFMEPFLICEICGQKHDVPIIKQMIDNARKNLKFLLKEYRNIAFWGIGKTVQRFLLELEVDKTNSIFLIDRNKSILGSKKIETPEKKLLSHIEYVIIAVPRYFGNIYNEAKDQYSIDNIIDICQLCNPKFIDIYNNSVKAMR